MGLLARIVEGRRDLDWFSEGGLEAVGCPLSGYGRRALEVDQDLGELSRMGEGRAWAALPRGMQPSLSTASPGCLGEAWATVLCYLNITNSCRSYLEEDWSHVTKLPMALGEDKENVLPEGLS